MRLVVFYVLGEDENVVDVGVTEVIEQVSQYLVDEALESRGPVGQSEW